VVATAVGDAPYYYGEAALAGFCVPAGDPAAAGAALLAVASSYEAVRDAFAVNGQSLAHRHGEQAADALEGIVEDAVRRR
jgi:hypothetical protein